MQKVVLITGATSGIGMATTKQLLSEGHVVYASSRSKESQDEINKLGGIPVEIEMTDESTMIPVVERVIKEQGRIDVLFNNAGYGLYGPVEEIPLETARHQFEVNLFGHARMTQLVLPHMRKQTSGLIINTSSMGGKIYFPLGAWYHATKHALEGWSDCLRLELNPLGIDVVIIEPGAIRTNFAKRMQNAIKDIGLGKTGAYDELLGTMNSAGDVGNDPNLGSSPQVIADVVSKAIKTKRPKTRYAAGQMAKPLMFMRKWFGDRMFDKIINFQMKRMIDKLQQEKK